MASKGPTTTGVTVCDAVISSCGNYRYWLGRHWGSGSRGIAVFLMLNPSTADGTVDDPTIRKCCGFARRWSLDGIHVVNLFAFRSTDPKGLLRCPDPIGMDNDGHIKNALLRDRIMTPEEAASRMVCAWGSPKNNALRRLVASRSIQLLAQFKDVPLWCLGQSKDQHPRHPLMISYDTPLQRFEGMW